MKMFSAPLTGGMQVPCQEAVCSWIDARHQLTKLTLPEGCNVLLEPKTWLIYRFIMTDNCLTRYKAPQGITWHELQ